MHACLGFRVLGLGLKDAGRGRGTDVSARVLGLFVRWMT